MALKAEFSYSDLNKRFNNARKEIQAMQIEALEHLGEICVTHAKNLPPTIGFSDRTGNLRSSMGYAVYLNGVAVRDSYVAVSGTESGDEGVRKGRELADSVAMEYPNGLLLVVTAGMEYAVYVEAKERDVLSSAQILAQREAPKMIKELTKNLKVA